jgi:ribosomal-protein-alanine N-acetyltransferase
VRGLDRAVATGERVFLRRPAPGDLDEFVAAVRRSRHLYRGWVEPARGSDGFALYVRRTRRVDCEGCVVCQLEDGAIAGVVNVNEIVRGGFQSGYLGYYVFEPFAARGFMREALRLMVERAFGPLALHRLEANIQPQNRRSRSLVEGLGFRLEGLSPRYLKLGGRWLDHERWAITVEDWREARRRERRGRRARPPRG